MRQNSISWDTSWPHWLRLEAFLWLPQSQQPVFHIIRQPLVRNQCNASTSGRRDDKPEENRRNHFSSMSSVTGFSDRPCTWDMLGKFSLQNPDANVEKRQSASSSCSWLFGMLSVLWSWSSPICTSVASPVTCKLNSVHSDDTQFATYAKLLLWYLFSHFCELF